MQGEIVKMRARDEEKVIAAGDIKENRRLE
jgi:hypothetical protein